tara:strand:- start:1974 stop:2174 length:201 start_codon:yes stop_codon:yes gene_type:complete
MIKWISEDGGMVYVHLVQCLKDLQTSSSNGYEFICNGVNIYVYKESCIQDLCDKFDLRRRLIQLGG